WVSGCILDGCADEAVRVRWDLLDRLNARSVPEYGHVASILSLPPCAERQILRQAPSETSREKCREERTGTWCPPHHHRRIDEADCDRLLAGHAGYAIRLRAAQPGK